MLSKEAERFLREFRIEMMAHGKQDEAIDDMEAELEDHLIQAEQDGKSVDSITGGSVKEYLKNISGEMPRVNNLKKYIMLFIVYLAGILTIPTLIAGTFEWSLSNLMYYAAIIVLGPLLIYKVYSGVIINHTCFKTEKIAPKGYVIIAVFSVLKMGFLIGGLFLVRNYPLVTFFEPSSGVNITIGFILLAVMVIGPLIMKQWFYSFLAFALAAPEIIAQIFADGGPQSESYITISAIALLAASILIMGTLLISSKKDAKKAKN
ncbi:hypothetical protein GCM10007275_16210 [Jeotgalicoccus coquinae]|uniref:Uncharacterized protein n=1 Tax=Jeotgalicoccus coquinae TaxID=709509 RepID=A0A6V7R142_9STAP|nr:hypothetical protein [Jeotgalicoccus coquinae]MBB6423699.1 hypothetical protein [Jeotgalicoccus coquinae]GGE21917.1 hypothetical protein GCM10007275_16210 [Jeotgalicoccus coquinae]CAD2071047.1 hypothetical protein JEOCOQ751_00109 [Jeotgalicoccus coquinae]